MPQHEFERFLALLSKLLKLSSKETAEIADELCDHLEERYSELVASGVSPEDAVKQALSEFEDATTLANRLTTIIRDRKRRRIMTGTLGTAAAAVALIATTAFWPDRPNQPGAPSIAVAANQEGGDKPATDQLVAATGDTPTYVDVGQFLPEGLRKPYPTDLDNVPLSEFAKSLQQLVGITVVIDRSRLMDQGVPEDTPLKARIKDVPAHLALNRVLYRVNGVQLDWSLEDDVLTITTEEESINVMQTVSIDVGPLLKSGYTSESLKEIVQSMTSEPWMDVDGEGGTIRNLGNVLTARNTLEGRLQVHALLRALELGEREIVVAEPDSNDSLWKALDKTVSIDVSNVPFSDVIPLIEKQVGAKIDLDMSKLEDAGIAAESPVTLSLANVSLRKIVQYLFNSPLLDFVIVDGRLLLTTEEEAVNSMMMAVFDVSDLMRGGDEDAIHELIQESVKGHWMNRDGEGGEVISGRPGTLIVRLTRDQFLELGKLLAVHRQMMSKDDPTPPPDPNEIEIRYYRLPDKTADDLVETIPRFVAMNSWYSNGPQSHPGQIGLIQKVYVGADTTFGGGGMGGGGGFFQMGGGVGGVPQPAAQAADAFPQAFTVLVIRQTRGVHKEIRKFINELLHGDANRTRGIPHPSDGISWPSQIDVPRETSEAPVLLPRSGQPAPTGTTQPAAAPTLRPGN